MIYQLVPQQRIVFMCKPNIDSSAILLGAYIIKVSRNTSSVIQYEKRHAFSLQSWRLMSKENHKKE